MISSKYMDIQKVNKLLITDGFNTSQLSELGIL